MLQPGVIPDTTVFIMSKNRETVLDTLFVIIMAISFSVFYFVGSMIVYNHHRSIEVLTSHISTYDGTIAFDYPVEEYPAGTNFRVTSMIYSAGRNDYVLWLTYFPEDNNETGPSVNLSDTVLASSIECPDGLIQAMEDKKAEFDERLSASEKYDKKYIIINALDSIIVAIIASGLSILFIKVTNALGDVKVKYIVLLIVVIASEVFEYSFYFKYLNFCK